jgi:hypothetical protein
MMHKRTPFTSQIEQACALTHYQGCSFLVRVLFNGVEEKFQYQILPQFIKVLGVRANLAPLAEPSASGGFRFYYLLKIH